MRDQLTDVAIPGTLPELREPASERVAVAHQFLETMEINPLVLPLVVQTRLATQTRRADLD